MPRFAIDFFTAAPFAALLDVNVGEAAHYSWEGVKALGYALMAILLVSAMFSFLARPFRKRPS